MWTKFFKRIVSAAVAILFTGLVSPKGGLYSTALSPKSFNNTDNGMLMPVYLPDQDKRQKIHGYK